MHSIVSVSFLAEPRRYIPAVVVGVVGMGHVPGIEKNWNSDLNIQEIMRYVVLSCVLTQQHLLLKVCSEWFGVFLVVVA